MIIQPSGTQKAGPVAAWITASGWALAARKRWGEAWMLTPDGLLTPEQAVARASRPELAPAARPCWWRRMPASAVQALKDVRAWREARRSAGEVPTGPWSEAPVAFVWQRHELFQRPGQRLARALGRPFVLFVSAPQVWEAKGWGVRRPGWSRWAERVGERSVFEAADLIVCVSEEVKDQIVVRGAESDRVLVAPCRADIESFRPDAPSDVRARYGLTDRFVVGWCGSFRPFHGLEVALDAVAAVRRTHPEVTLLFVGDGPERPRMEARARELGIPAVFTGTVPYAEVPAHMVAMDAALVLHPSGDSFHYGLPLKLSEYLACGVAVIAPRAGEVARTLEDGTDALLVERGAGPLRTAIERLVQDPEQRAAIGKAARQLAERDGTWDKGLDALVEALEARGFAVDSPS